MLEILQPYIVTWERSKRNRRPRMTWRFTYGGIMAGYNLPAEIKLWV